LEAGEPPRLARFLPIFHGSERERRRLSLSTDINNWLTSTVSSDFLTKLKAAVAVHLGQFIKGEEIDDDIFMKRVSDRRRGHHEFAHEVWAMRPEFNPKYRFFGAFFRADWFVVLRKDTRDNLKNDRQWHAQIDATCQSWGLLFPYTPRHSGNDFAEYVTFNAEHYDERW